MERKRWQSKNRGRNGTETETVAQRFINCTVSAPVSLMQKRCGYRMVLNGPELTYPMIHAHLGYIVAIVFSLPADLALYIYTIRLQRSPNQVIVWKAQLRDDKATNHTIIARKTQVTPSMESNLRIMYQLLYMFSLP